MNIESAKNAGEDSTMEAGKELFSAKESYQIILDINNAIISSLNLEDLFKAIAKSFKKHFPVDCTAVTLYDQKRDVLSAISIEPFSSSVELYAGFEMPREGSHSGWVLEHKKPFIARDISEKQKFAIDQMLLEQGLYSYIVLPLISRGIAIGTFNIGSTYRDRYNETHIEFAELIAKQLAIAISNATQHEEILKLREQLEHENIYLQEEIKEDYNFEEMIGSTAVMRKVFEEISRVAKTDSTALITGETGTGKELVARAIHNLSNRKERALIKVNCAALPSGLVESELFGHEKGAFTGAVARKKGRFELADNGSILLDEVGELTLDTQAKLLRALQEREIEPVGATKSIKVNVRVIASTNRDLQENVKQGTFRSDLFYRLNVFPIAIPALRERREDIPLLANYFLHKFSKRMAKRIHKISPTTIEMLRANDWPGNVRELANILERAVIHCDGTVLQKDHIAISKSDTLIEDDLKTLAEAEGAHILKVLEKTDGVVGGPQGAAKILGVNRTTLIARMKKLGIEASTG